MRDLFKKNKSILIFIVSCILIILIFVNGAEIKSEVYSSFINSVQNIIPSLFPGLVLTTFVSQIGFPKFLKKMFKFVFRIVFGLPSCCSEIMFFGLTSGYPTGVKTARIHAEKGLTDIKAAKRVALLSVNPGLMYTIITVGKLQYGSNVTGSAIYLCITLAQIIVGLCTKQKIEEHTSKNESVNKGNFGELFCETVKGATDTCFSMTAWIALFGAISFLLKKSPFINETKYFELILEVTNGISISIKRNSIEQCTFSMGFGGLCLMLQLLPDLIKLGITPGEYLSYRFAVGLLSSLFIKVFRHFLPVAFQPVFSSVRAVDLSANKFQGFSSILFLCVIFMYSLANRFAMC